LASGVKFLKKGDNIISIIHISGIYIEYGMVWYGMVWYCTY